MHQCWNERSDRLQDHAGSRRNALAKPIYALSMMMLAASYSNSPAALAQPGAALACAGQAYVSNSYSGGASASVPGSVSVIDTGSNEVVTSIPTGIGPINPTISPDGEKVYVAEADGARISVIDVRTRSVASHIQFEPGSRPSGLAFTPDGQRLVVTLLSPPARNAPSAGAIRVVTLATGEIGPAIRVGSHPERLALSPDGTRAYAVDVREDKLFVVDLPRREVVANINLGRTPFNILVSPQGDKVYVGNARDSAISVIDTATNRVIGSIETPAGPNGMAFSPDRQSIYVTNYLSSRISVVSVAENRVVRSAEIGEQPGHIRLTPDGRRAYIVRPQGTTVSVLDTSTLTITDTIETDRNPTTVAVCDGP